MERQIFIRVWQNIITPRKALDELMGHLIRDGTRDGTLSKKQEGQILEILEWVGEKSLTVNEAEEEIKWILNHKAMLCQTN